MHATFMHRCFELAARGRRRVGNGALVGAVLVRDGRIIAEGYHDRFGGPHAERALLESFAGRVLPDDTLYVNLEPCCHAGKTPPCTDILLDRGVRNVAIGMRDPDPRVRGRGVDALRNAGMNVTENIERAAAEYLNKGFIQLRKSGRPHVTLKMASDRAQRISNPDGTPRKITSPEQDSWSHEYLRARHDAIAVGIGTVLSDDPKLSRRFVRDSLRQSGLNANSVFQPYRLIFDAQFRIPTTANVVSDDAATSTILCVSPDALAADAGKRDLLSARGVRWVPVALDGEAFDWNALWSALATPVEGYPGIASMLLEGGRATWNLFRAAGMVDEEVRLIGR